MNYNWKPEEIVAGKLLKHPVNPDRLIEIIPSASEKDLFLLMDRKFGDAVVPALLLRAGEMAMHCRVMGLVPHE